MAFPVNFSFAAPVDRAIPARPLPAVPNRPAAGSLVMVDYFQDSPVEAAHGNVGAFAARQHGFRGAIYAEPFGPDTPPATVPYNELHGALSTPEHLSPKQTRELVQRFASRSAANLLNDASGDLDKIRGRGLHDSAVNISMGTDSARTANALYQELATAAQVQQNTRGLGLFGAAVPVDSQRLFDAYGVQPEQLTSSDPKIAGAAAAKLQSGLLADTRVGLQSAEVQKGTARFRQAVSRLEANHNSVTVAAGNENQIQKFWSEDSGGKGPRLTPADTHNPLAVPEVTTVGATQWLRGNGLHERIAPYSNRDAQVDLYASGAVGNGEDVNQKKVAGTSFASPRGGATLAEIHGRHPGMSSQAAERLARQQLTHSLSDGHGGQVSVLDYGRVSRYLSESTH